MPSVEFTHGFGSRPATAAAAAPPPSGEAFVRSAVIRPSVAASARPRRIAVCQPSHLASGSPWLWTPPAAPGRSRLSRAAPRRTPRAEGGQMMSTSQNSQI
jgi:hypothetical protein